MGILLSPGARGSTRPVCDCQRLAGAQSQELPDNLIPATFHSQEAFYETTDATHCSEPWLPPQVSSAALQQDCASLGRHNTPQAAWTAKATQAVCCLKSSLHSQLPGRCQRYLCSPRQNSVRHIPQVPELLLNQHPRCCRHLQLQRTAQGTAHKISDVSKEYLRVLLLYLSRC